jgi:hypothetical protein
MAKMRPAALLLLLQLLALAILAAWWVSLPALVRWDHLRRVQAREQVAASIPTGLFDQVDWLTAHRWQRLQGLTGWLMVAAVIAASEGMMHRRRDPLGGFRVAWWTVGRLGMALLLWTGVAFLVMPWPIQGVGVIGGLGMCIGGVSYSLALGRPYVP